MLNLNSDFLLTEKAMKSLSEFSDSKSACQDLKSENLNVHMMSQNYLNSKIKKVRHTSFKSGFEFLNSDVEFSESEY